MKKLVMMVLTIATIFVVISKPLHAQEYQVEPGDSLWKVARDFNTSVTELYQLNELDSEQIFPGQVLKVEEEEIIHLIERGDTLYALANRYEVTVLDLMNWNDLRSDLIITGNELVIYPTAEAVEADQEEAVKTVQAVINEAPKEPAKKASSENQTLTMTATAYTAECDGCSGITYTGLDLNKDRNMKVIAVDPSVIPLGTRVHVEGYGEAVAGDIGGAIKGNKIDIHVPTKDEAYSWGVREVTVTILD